MRKHRPSFVIWPLALAASLLFSACSPSSLFGGKNQDDAILNRAPYQPPNTECAGLDLSQSQFSVPAFRQLISCLNANHSIDAIHSLVKAMSDDELSPSVKLINEVILTPDFIKGSNALFSDLGNDLQTVFTDIGRVGDDPDFGISILRLIGEPETQSFLGRTFTFAEARQGVNRDLLAAFEVLADKMTRETFRDAIEVAANLATAPAFRSLVAKLRKSDGAELSLSESAALIVAFLRDSLDSRHFVDSGKIILEELKNDRIYQLVDELLGSTPEQLRQNTARFASVIETQARAQFVETGTSADTSIPMFDAITSLFHFGHQPIRCLEATQGVSSGALFVIRELSRIDATEAPDFLKRDKLLLQTLMKPVCAYPAAIAKYYPAITQFAGTTPIIPATELVQAIHRHGFDDRFAQIIGNTGKSGTLEGEDRAGIKRLTPILREFERRDLFKDLILIVTSLKPEQRPKAKAVAAFLLDSSDRRLKGKSLYEVFSRAIANQSPRNLLLLAQSLKGFTELDSAFFDRMTLAIRKAHYANDYDVVRETIARVLKESASRSDFYVSLLTASYRPEFRASLKDTAAMAKDGRLKEIFQAFLKMLERYGREQSNRPVRATLAARFTSNRAHELSSSDLAPFKVGPQPSKASKECDQIDLNFSLARTSDPRFAEQIERITRCFNSDGHQGAWVDSIHFLQRHTTGETPARTYLQAAIDLVKDHGLGREELRDLSNRLMNWVRGPEKKIERLFQAIPFIVSENVRGSPDDPGGPVLKPLFDMLKPVYDGALASWQALEAYGAKVLLRDDLPDAIRVVDKALNDETPFEPETARPTFNREKIRSWVENKECDYGSGKPPSSDAQARRVIEIENDYFDSVTSWNRSRDWKIADHRENLESVFKKIADLKQSDPNYPLSHALLQIMKYFTLEAGETSTQQKQFTPEDLIHFFYTHATDVRLINYIYPGEKKPRVRLVSSLERLELIVEEADFDAPWPIWPIGSKTNLAVQFLTRIGMAWGDEPREIWPEPIQKMYPRGTTPPTLKDAIRELVKTAKQFENLMGFPNLPPCKRTPDFTGPDWPKSIGKFPNIIPPALLNGMSVAEMQRRLFNLNQVISIAVENLPGQPGKLAGGMRILRNLFYELAISSPEAIRAREPGTIDERLGVTSDSYNITFIRRNVQMGLPRLIGNLMKRTRENDPMLRAFVRAFIEAAAAPETETFLQNLFSRDSRILTRIEESTVWKAALEIEKMLTRDRTLSDDTWQEKLNSMRQFVFYGVPLLSQLQIVQPTLDSANAIIENFRAFLNRNIDLLSDALTNEVAARAVRSVYENDESCARGKRACKNSLASILQDALSDRTRAIHLFDVLTVIETAGMRDSQVKDPLRTFKNRYDVVKSKPAFRSLDLHALVEDVIHFFEETPEEGNRATATQLRRFLARLIQSGEGDRWMRLAAMDPNGTYGLAQLLSHYSKSGELLEFLRLLERNVVNFETSLDASAPLGVLRRRDEDLFLSVDAVK